MSISTNIQNKVKKILIADDDSDILESLKMMLEMVGYDVKTTLRAENIATMFRFRPDLLLLDIRLSGKDGREVCRDIKRKKETKKIPVIMISANNDVAKSAKDSGADDFIAKPFEVKDLLNKVKKHISSN